MTAQTAPIEIHFTFTTGPLAGTPGMVTLRHESDAQEFIERAPYQGIEITDPATRVARVVPDIASSAAVRRINDLFDERDREAERRPKYRLRLEHLARNRNAINNLSPVAADALIATMLALPVLTDAGY